MLSLTQNTSRQREIAEVVLRNGWEYMRQLLAGSKTDAPQLPPPAVLRNIFIDLGPVYVKLGQLLSTRPDLLPKDYIEALTDLQANVPSASWVEIETLLCQQLRQPLDKIFREVDREPIAAGSIAQTHRAIFTDGQVVALKIQRPGIERIVEQDISLINAVADLVSRTDLGQDYDIVAIAEEFTSALRAELDFRQEARYTDRLRQNLAASQWFNSEQLVIPQVYWEQTTQKVLVLEWLNGVPILQTSLATEAPQRGEIASLLFKAFSQQIFVDGFFHADPHPGNLFYLNDGRVALLDCGMIGRLDPRTQQILTELLFAIIEIDARRCVQLTVELAESSEKVNLSKLENSYDRLLRKYYNLSLSQINFSAVLYEILGVARENKIKLPGNLGLYAKSLANLEGVARGFYPQINLIDEIRPLMGDLLQRQLVGSNLLPTAVRLALDLKRLSFQSPRQVELLLDRITAETLQWNFSVRELVPLRRSLDDSANRLSFSIVVGSLLMGAAIISTSAKTVQLTIISDILFGGASILGLWLIISILRSGRLR
ncbi:MAG: AarF/ABC1/UbiB kinase family protein [Cyanobacteria bacterium J06641_5]